MTDREVFQIWAPLGAKWVDWVRPVPFIAINARNEVNRSINFAMPTITYINKTLENTALILDLPGSDSIKEGLALAILGFRPIPLYNGTDEQQGAMALVDNQNIKNALIRGALELEKIDLSLNAPPVFLIDSNRTHQYKMNVSVFDNSWDLYSQDMPSAEYFINNNINKIIVRGETIKNDLVRILYDFQVKGIVIFFTDGYDEPKVTTVPRPRKHK